ncbi:MAG TPA: YkgJ family cysteine cluster protein [Gammaproteobacteria bacterium]|nr:YkgJ family cysteine cluster protein [Gammaproteobacteria bacterium]
MEFSDIKDSIPHQSPVQPQELGLDAEFQFDCHPGVSCFNACCKKSDIQMTPYDIVRLKKHFDLSSSDFVSRYTVPFEMDQHGMPGLRLLSQPKTGCVFLGDEGCTVYKDRPAACRYYALGSMGVRKAQTSRVEDVYFVVKEAHCQGHAEPRKQTVQAYRENQGVDQYDVMNNEWREIILKKRSSGPTVGAPSERSLQLFDMCSYDIDSFREFIQTKGFQNIFDVGGDRMKGLLEDDEKLLFFSFRFLKQVLFGEVSIPVREQARAQRVSERQGVWAQRRNAEVDRYREDLQVRQYEDRPSLSDDKKREDPESILPHRERQRLPG